MKNPYFNIFLYWFVEKTKIDHDFEKQFISALYNNYGEEDQKQITEALKWAVNEKDIDFNKSLPGITISNKEIRKKLINIIAMLKT